MTRCHDVMRSNVISCRVSDPAGWAAALMRDFDTGFLPVSNGNGVLVGVLTERDLAVRVVADGRPSTTEVGEVMSHPVALCRPDEEVRNVEERMRGERRSRLPVVDLNGVCIGIVSLADVSPLGRPPADGAWLHDIRNDVVFAGEDYRI